MQKQSQSSKVANSLQQSSLEKTYTTLRHSGTHVLASFNTDNFKSEKLLLWSLLLSGLVLQIITKTKARNPLPQVTYSAGFCQLTLIFKMSLPKNTQFTSWSKCPKLRKNVLSRSVEKLPIMHKILFLTSQVIVTSTDGKLKDLLPNFNLVCSCLLFR